MKLFPFGYDRIWPNFIKRLSLPLKLFNNMYFLFYAAALIQTSKNVADTAFNVKKVKQKPLEVFNTWKVFWNCTSFQATKTTYFW